MQTSQALKPDRAFSDAMSRENQKLVRRLCEVAADRDALVRQLREAEERAKAYRQQLLKAQQRRT